MFVIGKLQGDHLMVRIYATSNRERVLKSAGACTYGRKKNFSCFDLKVPVLRPSCLFHDCASIAYVMNVCFNTRVGQEKLI